MLQNSLFEIATPAKASPVRKGMSHAKLLDAQPEVDAGQPKPAFKPMLAHEQARQNERERNNARDVEPSSVQANGKNTQQPIEKKAKLDQKVQEPQRGNDQEAVQYTKLSPPDQDQKVTDLAEDSEAVVEKVAAFLTEETPEGDAVKSEEASAPALLIAQAYVEATKSDSSQIDLDALSLDALPLSGEVLSSSLTEGGEAAPVLIGELEGAATPETIMSSNVGVEAVSTAPTQALPEAENSAPVISQATVATPSKIAALVETGAEEAVLEKALPLQASIEKSTPAMLATGDHPKSAHVLQGLEASAAQVSEASAEESAADNIKFEANLATKGDAPRASASVPQIGARAQSSEPMITESFTDLTNTPYGMRGLSEFARALEGATLEKAAGLTAQHHASQTLRPTPLQMLPIEIGMQVMRGANSFQIRLDPAELGRVDVKLEVNSQGEVNAHLIVERPETLQMLRRDSTTLQYAFEQAGLKSSQDGLNFSLKGEGQNGQNQSQNGSSQNGTSEEDPALKTQIEHIALRRMMIPHSSIDRMV